MNTIEEAIEAIKNGKIVIVVDDEDRENEGDFITAARNITPEIVNFMATHGRGLICVGLIEDRCEELGLNLMVNDNTALHATPFTVSVDLIGYGCTTGISASDRAKTIKALINPKIKAEELARPGHIFPLKAKRGGVLRRTGHTEAAIDLSRLAGFEPAGVLVEIMNEDGSMARLPELRKIAERFSLKIVSIEDLVAYRMKNESLIKREIEVEIETQYGPFKLIAYKQITNDVEHLALVKGIWNETDEVLVRVHSSGFVSDIFSYFKDNGGTSIQKAMKYIADKGAGAIVYIQQENRNLGMINKLKSLKANLALDDNQTISIPSELKMDNKDFGIGAQILRDLGVRKMKLITKHPTNRTGITGYGLEIVETVSIE